MVFPKATRLAFILWLYFYSAYGQDYDQYQEFAAAKEGGMD